MLTQICYARYNTLSNLWVTVSSDNMYSTNSRVRLHTNVKPTARQVRRLHKYAKSCTGNTFITHI